MFTLYVDEDSEDLRVRACHWIYGGEFKGNVVLRYINWGSVFRCKYEDVSDFNTLPYREDAVSQACSAFW